MNNDMQPNSNPTQFHDGDKLFADPILSGFGDFVRESARFFYADPKIHEKIAADQKIDALKAKHRRNALANDEICRSTHLPGMTTGPVEACSMCLGTGRPRIHPLVVFIFLMLRGRCGGSCDQTVRELILESRSLEVALLPYVDHIPGATTILENINCLQDSTLEYIHRAFLKVALDEGLDDFSKLAVDSTAIKAASAWPTDSKTIVDLCGRFLREEIKLESWGLQRPGDACCKRWWEQLQALHKSISMVGSGKGAKARRKQLYRDFFQIACQLLSALLERYQNILQWQNSGGLEPYRGELAACRIDALGEDVFNACTTLRHAVDRIEEIKMPKTRERVLGIADRAAAIIVKGGREPVIGYKPQLARTEQGMITVMQVDSGNPSDSACLEGVIKASIEAVSIVPAQVSADDGYSSLQGVNAVKELGVGEVSISGAKGKRLLGEEAWELESMKELRAWRSSVESVMFVLKHGYRFGQLGRRGIEAVRRELTEKVLAYNLERILLLRRRKESKQIPKAA